MRIAVAGAGFVGLATAVGFARRAAQVHVFETDASRVRLLGEGTLPFADASLAIPFAKAIEDGVIQVHEGYPTNAGAFDFAFVCVPTPPTANGHLDVSIVTDAVRSLIACCDDDLRIVIRSTVNPGTAEALTEMECAGTGCVVLSNPEFLEEGNALAGFETPSRIVIGAYDREAAAALADTYAFTDAPIFLTDPTTAETVKLAANAALALRVSMANEIAAVARSIGADPEAVLRGVGADPRIGSSYLRPGLGFGGSCLPKDLEAFRWLAREAETPAPCFDAASETNEFGVRRLAALIQQRAEGSGVTVGIVGMAFKPHSDSIRRSLSMDLARTLLELEMRVIVHDPRAESNVWNELGARVEYAASFAETVHQADVTIVIDPSLADGSIDGGFVLDSLGQPFASLAEPARVAIGREIS